MCRFAIYLQLYRSTYSHIAILWTVLDWTVSDCYACESAASLATQWYIEKITSGNALLLVPVLKWQILSQ